MVRHGYLLLEAHAIVNSGHGGVSGSVIETHFEFVGFLSR